MRARLAVWLALILALVALGQADAVRLNTGTGRALIAPQSSSGQFSVNFSGAEFAPWNGQTFPTLANWNDLQAKRVKFVRLPIAWESAAPVLSGPLDPTYLANIQTALSRAAARGIRVIVDLHNFGQYCDQAHWVSSGCGYAGNAAVLAAGVSVLGDATLTQAAFADFWSRLATALAGNPGLLGYGLMNEPSSNIIRTNLFFAPNGFADDIGSQPWFGSSSPVLTQQAPGTNPDNATYSPAWSITSGTGFAAINQSLSTHNVSHAISMWVKSNSGTVSLSFIQDFTGIGAAFNATTSWTRQSRIFTPTAASHNLGLSFNVGAGTTISIADAQLEENTAATAYKPNAFLPYAQAAVTAIRLIDAVTPIYVNGYWSPSAYAWPWTNWDLLQLTGGNIVFEAHQYFDGTVAQGGGGSAYAQTFSFYGIDTTAGVQEVAPFVSWLSTTSQKGFVGEFNVPNSVADANPQWLILQDNFTRYLKQNGVPGTIWFYNSGLVQPSNILGIAPQNGIDDPRLLNMLRFNYLLERDLGAANDDRPAFLAAAA